jgi:hypothetical protein
LCSSVTHTQGYTTANRQWIHNFYLDCCN